MHRCVARCAVRGPRTSGAGAPAEYDQADRRKAQGGGRAMGERPRVYVRAADSIGDYKPIPSRLLIREPFDYAAQGLPSPAQSYLDSLESPDSKRNMGYALDIF